MGEKVDLTASWSCLLRSSVLVSIKLEKGHKKIYLAPGLKLCYHYVILRNYKNNIKLNLRKVCCDNGMWMALAEYHV
jgi:hypothetical protein